MKKSALTIIIILLSFNTNYSSAQSYLENSNKQSSNEQQQSSDNTTKANSLEDNAYKITELPDIPNNEIKEDTNSTTQASSPMELSIKTERLTSGTKLKIIMNTILNAKVNREGDPFSAIVKDDVIVNNEIIIPSGTLIRGRVEKVKKPGLFHKSGSIYLNFDHIVTPLGKQLRFDAGLEKSDKVNNNGVLSGGKNLSETIIENAISSFDTTKTITKAGYDIGMTAGKVPVIVTAPAGAAIGGITGTTIFATKTTIALFKKGGNIIVNPGELFEVNFLEDIDVPVN